MKKSSIQKKLLFITIGSIFVLTAVTSAFISYLDHKDDKKMAARHIELMRNSIVIKGEILSRDIARYTENAIASYNFFSISATMGRRVKDTYDLEYGILVDNAGVVHVHTENPKRLETKLDSEIDKFALQQIEPATIEYEKDGVSYLEFITPLNIGGSLWGYLRLGFSLAAIEMEIQNTRLSMKKQFMTDVLTWISITLVFAFIGSILVAYGTKRITNPLLQLVGFSKKLADENFNIQVPKSISSSNDEIGELGRSFEYMAKQIDLSHIQLKGYSRNLEQEIIVRRYAVDQLTERIKHAEFNADIGTALASGETLHEALQKCTEAMVKHLDAAFARIWTYNEKEKMLELRASAGIYTHIDGKHSRVPLGKLKVGLIAEERLPCLTNSVIGDTRISDQDWAKNEGMKAFAGYPLMIENSVVGVMAMFSKKEIAFDTIAYLELVANQVALGIQRKLAESELRQSENRFRNIVETSGDWVWEVNEDLVYSFVSPKISTSLGYVPEEIIGKSPFDIMLPEEANRVSNILKPLMTKQKAFNSLENQKLHKNGGTIFCETSGVPFFSSDKRFKGYRGIVRDITERKRTEVDLKKSKDYLEKLNNSIGDVIINVKLLERKIEYINNAVENIFGYKPGECIGKTTEFFYPNKKAFLGFGKKIENAVKQGKISLITEVQHIKKNGTLFLSEVTLTFLKEKGKYINSIAIVRDITERKQAESAQKQFSKRLVESQENERKRIASELHDSLAQNMLVINSEAQNFILNMTKKGKDLDIRKLMSSIASRSLTISSTALESLKKIKEIAYNLRPAELDQIGLKKTIEWTSKMVSKSSGIDIHAKIDLKETTISKELEIQIYRIIQEGLNNIVKHSLASEGIIELKRKDDHISLLIIDDGKGFENYYRDKQTSTMDGFGLQGIEERVKIFDGTLLVDSSLGKGTKLKISIPIK